MAGSGANDYGQIGNRGIANHIAPVAVLASSGAIATRKVLGIFGGTSHSLALIAAGVAPTVTTHPSNRAVAIAGSVTFTAASDGGYPAATVKWQESPAGAGGTFSNIIGNATATTGTLVLTNVAASRDGYAYRAVFTNIEASLNSTPAILTVVPPPTLNVPTNIIEGATDKTGKVVSFTVTANDNLDGPLVPTCNPPSGSTFPIGSTREGVVERDLTPVSQSAHRFIRVRIVK